VNIPTSFALAAFLFASSFSPVLAEPPRNPFFAMNTIARGDAKTVVPLLAELGYDGLGGSAGDGAMASALEARGLHFFNGYLTLEFHAESAALDDALRHSIEAMKGHDCALWLAIAKVDQGGKAFPISSTDADSIALGKLREIADFAEPLGVKIALYPHTGTWLERATDAVRLAEAMNRPSVGATFNLCHWLKVEGAQRDPEPVLKQALPHLMFVTINGADTGDTKAMGWDRLIQPLDRGSYDIGAFLGILRRIGYGSPIGFQGYGIQGDQREILTRTMQAWKKLNAAGAVTK
jgi:sugar phosphate isomerase/epimerase